MYDRQWGENGKPLMHAMIHVACLQGSAIAPGAIVDTVSHEQNIMMV